MGGSVGRKINFALFCFWLSGWQGGWGQTAPPPPPAPWGSGSPAFPKLWVGGPVKSPPAPPPPVVKKPGKGAGGSAFRDRSRAPVLVITHVPLYPTMHRLPSPACCNAHLSLLSYCNMLQSCCVSSLLACLLVCIPLLTPFLLSCISPSPLLPVAHNPPPPTVLGYCVQYWQGIVSPSHF